MKQTKTIGSILVDVELVTLQDIEQALEQQRHSGKRLGEVLVELGAVSDDDIRWALAEQLNLPYVNIRKDQIDPEVATLLPEKLARRYHVIPILKIDDELTVVVDDPLNKTIIEDIEQITKTQVKISLGRTSDILLAIDEIYGSGDETAPGDQENLLQVVSPWFHEDDLQKILNDPSGQILLEKILTTAFAHDISSIYFQPNDDQCRVSYRVNTLLQEQLQLGREWYSILLFRLKISAGFEMPESQYPQYREFFYVASSAKEEEQPSPQSRTLAVSLLPTISGESVVLHVIHKSVDHLPPPDLEESPLGTMQAQELDELRPLRTRLPHLKAGIVLLGGAPHPDKIATLYTLLQEFDPLQKKIMTVEAALEYRTDKYYQVGYSPGGAWSASPQATFQPTHPPDAEFSAAGQLLHPEHHRLASWLAAIPAQEADVLLVDRIGHEMVLAQCLDLAARSLVLGALECTHVFDMLAYVLDCQIKPTVITSRVVVLLAQQAIRLLCPTCKQKTQSEKNMTMLQNIDPEIGNTFPLPDEIYVPVGCPECQMTGYAHRVILFEVLPMRSWLKDMLHERTPLADIQRTANGQGFRSLRHKSLDLVIAGHTSIEEILSILT